MTFASADPTWSIDESFSSDVKRLCSLPESGALASTCSGMISEVALRVILVGDIEKRFRTVKDLRLPSLLSLPFSDSKQCSQREVSMPKARLDISTLRPHISGVVTASSE